MSEDTSLIGYSTPFTLDADALELVPTNTARNVTREGNKVTLTVGADEDGRTITVTKDETRTPSDSQHTDYITESVYGHPTLRDVLAHFEEGVETVTVHTDHSLSQGLFPGRTFTYEGTTYAVVDEN